MPTDTLQYLFIVGVGRSGTTLLQSMINAHPRIAIMPETHFVIAQLVPRTDASLEEARQRLAEDARFGRLGLEMDDVFAPFTSGDRPFSQAALFRELFDRYAAEHGVTIVGDKAPKNIEHLPLIKTIMPDAYVIHLVRDPRDVYLSRTKAKWSAGRSDTMQYLAYRAQFGMGRHSGRQLFGDRYLELHYEQLISDPTSELKRVAALVGVPFDEAMLDFGASGKKLVADDEKDWKGNVSGPLLTKNMNKWRDQMPPTHVRKLEAACWPVFAENLYERSPDSPRGLGLGGTLTNTYMAALSWLYGLRTNRINRRCARTIERDLAGSSKP